MMPLAATFGTADSLALASAWTSVVVAALAIAMSFVAFRASRRRGNPALRIVGIAFAVFALKNLFSAYNVGVQHMLRHDAIELVLSLFDLVLLILLFMPLLRRRRRSA